ncbi:Hypothetical predicted protein [Pelobates cultripes]|uniref:Uncharacterized protein n=1 Tax=Pelobates cultripes TaxID=61616 RepID=A0AAD1W049_PELCU|nr:Hypothetical predicted protein [Pelobates cultripes]
MTTNEIESLETPIRREDNLTAAERRALTELSHEPNLVIKASDKGGNIILLDKNNYIEMCMEHLQYKQHYSHLPKDPTTEYLIELKSILEAAELDGIISKDEYKFIILNMTPTIATFYCLPKIHKNPVKPPGRPIAMAPSLKEAANSWRNYYTPWSLN